MNKQTQEWLKSNYKHMRTIHKLIYDKYFNIKRYTQITNMTNPSYADRNEAMRLLMAFKARLQLGLASQIYFLMILPTIFLIRRTFVTYKTHSLFLLLPGVGISTVSCYCEFALRKYEKDLSLKNKEAIEKYN